MTGVYFCHVLYSEVTNRFCSYILVDREFENTSKRLVDFQITLAELKILPNTSSYTGSITFSSHLGLGTPDDDSKVDQAPSASNTVIKIILCIPEVNKYQG